MNATPKSIAPAGFRFIAVTAAWVVALLTAAAQPAAAAVDMFLKIEGIPGELTAGRFSGWSRVSQAGGGILPSEDPVAPPVHQYSVSKELDKSSPLIAQRCATGTHIPRLTLAWMDGAEVFYRIVFNDVVISRVSLSGNAKTLPAVQQEAVSFTYQKIEWTCVQLGGDGSDEGGLKATFDLATAEGELKPREPFRAGLAPQGGREPGVRIQCPVEAGHRYRLMGNRTLDGEWTVLQEFTPAADGSYDQFIPAAEARLFLKIEQID